ncbi:MAG: tRNA (adenosine(37)-N6)-dimethylallyltransferase MiaA [Syntrophobacterales bacterium]|nr:MAG: tRNA (adenosine(37)-N6)-dimethylallyltransferase MiaA [Syntrophobacterales bacterium]
MKKRDYNLIVILGPTATGKTMLAARLGRDLTSEIISADSRQVYRDMNLGTGKDLEEFVVDGVAVPYHLIDIVDPTHEFSVFEYQKRFYEAFLKISRKGIVPIMVGGTGLYIEAIIEGYSMREVPENPDLRDTLEKEDGEALGNRLHRLSPTHHNTTDLLDRNRLIRAIEIAEYTESHKLEKEEERPEIVPLVIGIRYEREMIRQRIRDRLQERIKRGMIDEVKSLHASGVSWDKLDFFGLEYRYVSAHLQGKMGYDEMCDTLATKINQFSKRQITWFRRMERRGTVIHWIDGADYTQLKDMVSKHLLLNVNER